MKEIDMKLLREWIRAEIGYAILSHEMDSERMDTIITHLGNKADILFNELCSTQKSEEEKK